MKHLTPNSATEYDHDDWSNAEYTAPSAVASAGLHEPMPKSAPKCQKAPHPTNLEQEEFEDKDKGPEIPHRDKPDYFPAFMSRSAMFKAGRASEDMSTFIEFPAQGCTLRCRGPRLTMKDKHVWETAIQIAKESSPGLSSSFEIGLRDFARRMGHKDFCSKTLTPIWNSLERLACARIEFDIPGQCSGVGSMLSTAAKRGNQFYLRLNPDFALPALMGDKQFKIRSERRAKLSSSLAQWLHDFYSTHSAARDLDLGYLRKLCGYDSITRNFANKLDQAMKELSNIAPELIASFEIIKVGRESDLWKLRVVRGTEGASYKMPTALPSKKPRRYAGVAL